VVGWWVADGSMSAEEIHIRYKRKTRRDVYCQIVIMNSDTDNTFSQFSLKH
jgi:hypothetical protein